MFCGSAGAQGEVGSRREESHPAGPHSLPPCQPRSMTPTSISLFSELQTHGSRCLLDSATWKPHDHLQLSASLSELMILPLTWFSPSAPIPGTGVSILFVGSLANGEKPTSCSLPQNLLQDDPVTPFRAFLLLTLCPLSHGSSVQAVGDLLFLLFIFLSWLWTFARIFLCSWNACL